MQLLGSTRISVLATTILAGLTLLLVVANAALVFRNQSVQGDINQRQQYINESAGLARLNDVLAKTLAATAYEKKDDALKALLHDAGIEFSVAPAPAAATTPSAPAAPAGK